MTKLVEKIKNFKDNLLIKNKQMFSDCLIEKTSPFSHKWGILSILLIPSIFYISYSFSNWVVLQNHSLFMLLIIISYFTVAVAVVIFSLCYIEAYVSSVSNRNNIKSKINGADSLKKLSELSVDRMLSSRYEFFFESLIFKDKYLVLENKQQLVNQLSYLSVDGLKELKKLLTKDEFNIFIKNLPDYYDAEKKSFNIAAIDDFLNIFAHAESEEKERDEIISILSDVNGEKINDEQINYEQNDLLTLMLKECDVKKIPNDVSLAIKRML